MKILQLTGDDLIKAAQRAVLQMTTCELDALEKEVIKLPAYPTVKKWEVHQGQFHIASSQCSYCVAEMVEVFVRREGL